MPNRRAEANQELSVLVVDDEETIVEFLQMGLQYEGFTVEVANDGETALEIYRKTRPDLVILDWMLPGKDGLEVCRRIRAMGDTPVIMLTAKGDVDDRVTGLDAGADDYIPKPFKFKELLARMRAVLRRRNVSFGQILTVGDIVLNRETREVTRQGNPVELTPREFDLLELFMAHPRQVFSRETIMNRIWGYDFVGDTNIIDVHISYLRTKLGDADRNLIQTVRSVGYVMRG
jgi:DNA-binding response OmpR family regulator